MSRFWSSAQLRHSSPQCMRVQTDSSRPHCCSFSSTSDLHQPSLTSRRRTALHAIGTLTGRWRVARVFEKTPSTLRLRTAAHQKKLARDNLFTFRQPRTQNSASSHAQSGHQPGLRQKLGIAWRLTRPLPCCQGGTVADQRQCPGCFLEPTASIRGLRTTTIWSLLACHEGLRWETRNGRPRLWDTAGGRGYRPCPRLSQLSPPPRLPSHQRRRLLSQLRQRRYHRRRHEDSPRSCRRRP